MIWAAPLPCLSCTSAPLCSMLCPAQPLSFCRPLLCPVLPCCLGCCNRCSSTSPSGGHAPCSSSSSSLPRQVSGTDPAPALHFFLACPLHRCCAAQPSLATLLERLVRLRSSEPRTRPGKRVPSPSRSPGSSSAVKREARSSSQPPGSSAGPTVTPAAGWAQQLATHLPLATCKSASTGLFLPNPKLLQPISQPYSPIHHPPNKHPKTLSPEPYYCILCSVACWPALQKP